MIKLVKFIMDEIKDFVYSLVYMIEDNVVCGCVLFIEVS